MKSLYPILVTGAEGFTGKFVCQELIKREYLLKLLLNQVKTKNGLKKENYYC